MSTPKPLERTPYSNFLEPTVNAATARTANALNQVKFSGEDGQDEGLVGSSPGGGIVPYHGLSRTGPCAIDVYLGPNYMEL